MKKLNLKSFFHFPGVVVGKDDMTIVLIKARRAPT